MCTTLILADGTWVGSITEMRVAGFENVEAIQLDPDWTEDDCFCGVDLDDYLAADSRNWVWEDGGFWVERPEVQP